jgi:integrase
MRKLPVAISQDEWRELMKHTLKMHHKVAFLLGFEAGLRISEIVDLEARDIDYARKSILVRQGKGSKDRVVPLPKGFRATFLQHIPIKCGVRSLERAFKRAAAKAKLLETKPSLHFHSLRHGFASHMVNKGVPLHHVRTLMGHSNISTTNVYLEMNPKEALEKYEELF